MPSVLACHNIKVSEALNDLQIKVFELATRKFPHHCRGRTFLYVDSRMSNTNVQT
jgi:hypothetical protein